MPLQATSGAASQDAFGGNGVAVVPTYIEDVFSTYLYTGTGASLTITNNIDLSTKGGMVWIKSRSAATDHKLTDTARGVTKALISYTTAAQTTDTTGLTAFGTTGFTIGANTNYNTSAATYASWTFRKQPKFFDIVTYTGTGSNTTISHALGSVPACIMVKRTDTTGDWQVYHRSLANTEYLVLNSTAAKATGATRWNSTTPTSSVFSLGTDATVNASGGTYVAYIFAHDAGGFGLTGTDNVISCGTWTENGTVQDINLGYEPQFFLTKLASGATGDWFVYDSMRGWPNSGTPCTALFPNTSTVEISASNFINPTATGFKATPYDGSGTTHIYIAIRRGPMKVPTTGTSVYKAITYNGVGTAGQVLTGSGFPIDLAIAKCRSTDSGFNFTWMDRLRGGTAYLFSNTTGAEGNTAGYYIRSFDMDGVTYGTTYGDYTSSAGSPTYVLEGFRRAPSFFDEVCYTGTGANTTQSHNLGVVPELIIVKRRDAVGAWEAYSATLANTEYLVLNTTAAKATGATRWNSTTPTSSVFSIGTSTTVNASAGTYVAYLFATCAGVSKCTSFTGTGTLQTINCGFTSGSRFVLIKRTDFTGDWYVWDSSRGLSSSTDPYLLLNSTAAEVTSTNWVDTTSTGFQVTAASGNNVNLNGASYIALAIA